MRLGADPLELSEPQQEARFRGSEHFRSNDRGLLVGACGSGKTLIAISIAQNFVPAIRSVLLVVPTRLLVRQAIEDWKKNFDPEVEMEFVAVCSDKGVRGDISNEEIAAAGSIVTTDARDLRRELNATLAPGMVRVVVSTYNSLPVVAEAQEGKRSRQFDFAIADEAHHTAGLAARGKEARSFQMILDPRQVLASRKLFMTATPRVVVPRKRRGKRDLDVADFGVDEKEVFSMDDESVYGRIFYELTLAQAIEDEEVRVVPYRVVPHFVRRSDLDFVRDPAKKLPYAAMTEEEASGAYVLEDLMDRMPDFGASRVITYHDRKSKAKAFQEVLTELNDHRSERAPFAASYLDGTMSMEARVDILSRFSESSGAHGVLSNCKALTEGINVSANSLLFADPKGSVVEVMQAIGRIIRRGADAEKVGTVVVPLVVDDTDYENPQVTAESVARLRRILYAGKLVDAKISTRIEIPEEPAHPHPLNDFGQTSEGGVKIARMVHLERGWLSTNQVIRTIEETKEEIRSLSSRDYFGVEWSEETGYWRAQVENPWFDDIQGNPNPREWGSSRQVSLGYTFEDAEAAALAVDDFIRQNKLDWQTNFGHNPHRAEDVRTNIRSRFPGKISFAPSRSKSSRWRAYIDLLAPDENGEMKKVKPNAYYETEEVAIAAHDAFCERYGQIERVIHPEETRRYDLILNASKLVEEGIERETYFENVPGRQFWAYVRDEEGAIHPVGEFATVEEARAARDSLLEQMRNRGNRSEGKGEVEEIRARMLKTVEKLEISRTPNPPRMRRR